MRVSFIITLFNKAPFIRAMARSVLDQAGDFERRIVVVDDGSTDGSLAVAREAFGEGPTVTYLSQPNAGPSSAFAAGCRRADGDVLKFVDGDDILAPDICVKLLATMDASGARYVHAGYRWWDIRQGAYAWGSGRDEAEVVPVEPLMDVIRRATAGSSSVLVGRDAYEAVGGFDEGVFVQDYSLPLRIAHRFKVAHRPEILAIGPEAVEDRVVGTVRDNVAQIAPQVYHDINLSVARFLEQTPDLCARVRAEAALRCAKRLRSFARPLGALARARMTPAFTHARVAATGWASRRDPRRAARACRDTCDAIARISPTPIRLVARDDIQAP